MSKELTTILVIIMIAVTVISILLQVIKRSTYNKLAKAASQNDFKTFDEVLNSWRGKLLNKLEYHYVMLNSGFMRGDEKMIEAEFKELDKLNLNRKFTIDILSKKFDFYMYKEQKTKALEILDKIKELKEEKLYKHLYSIYDITFNKRFENIDDLLKLYEKEEDIYQKAIYEMVISEMYLKDGNEEKAKEYLARYQEHIKEEEK